MLTDEVSPATMTITTPTVARSAAELAVELRREFERTLFERYGQPPGQDPVLAALFHAAAVQLARVYDEAEQVFPEAVFDDLVAGLGVPPRAAQPAQTVVQISGVFVEPETVPPQLPLVAYTPQGERLVFGVDVPVTASGTSLAFAGVVADKRVHALAGATIPGGQGLDLPAGSAPLQEAADAPASFAMAPSLVLAFETGREHLDGLGLFIDSDDGDGVIARALARSAWHLLDADGLAHEVDVLRSRPGPGGVRLLELARGGGMRYDNGPDAAAVLGGPYGPQCWVFPRVPEASRHRGHPPRALAGVLRQFVLPEHAGAYDRPLTWVQVQLPAETCNAANGIRRVVANCASASNLDVQTERLSLGQIGEVVTRDLRASDGHHLLTVLGVVGEQGDAYALGEGDAGEVLRGQYRVRGTAVRVRAARGPAGRFDRHVTVRSLYTDGARGNAIGVGDVRQFGAALASPTAEVVNLTPARGGGAPPAPAAARVRFAELLRTRERAVTPADVDIAMRAYEPRVLATDVRSSIAVDDDGAPARAEVVTVDVRAADFDDPGSEFVRLAAGLERHLRQRTAPSTRIRVRVRAIDRPYTRG